MAAIPSSLEGAIIRPAMYRNGKLIVKWDLENRKPMKGKASARVLELIEQLEGEGLL